MSKINNQAMIRRKKRNGLQTLKQIADLGSAVSRAMSDFKKLSKKKKDDEDDDTGIKATG